jgi:hypothetical protein
MVQIVLSVPADGRAFIKGGVDVPPGGQWTEVTGIDHPEVVQLSLAVEDGPQTTQAITISEETVEHSRDILVTISESSINVEIGD